MILVAVLGSADPTQPLSGVTTEKKSIFLRSDNYHTGSFFLGLVREEMRDGTGQLCPISDFAEKTRGRRPISDKIGKTDKESGLEIGRGSGPTPVARGGLPRARSPGMGEGGDWRS